MLSKVYYIGVTLYRIFGRGCKEGGRERESVTAFEVDGGLRGLWSRDSPRRSSVIEERENRQVVNSCRGQ